MGKKTATPRVALITGASSGIGKATAIKLSSEGLKLVLIARRSDKLEELAEQVQEMGGEALCISADVGIEAEARAAALSALDAFGVVDILINNAGILRPGAIEDQLPHEWRDTLDVNLLAPMYLTQALLPPMKKRGNGHIVNVSSTAAKVQLGPNLAAYSASKVGITAFSAALRKEVAPHGIRVTIVEPGTTDTDVAESIPDKDSREFMESCVRRNQAMQPEDIAEAIFYAIQQPARVNVDEIWVTPTFG